jgi:serine/threonine protein phosphatase PrpC
MELQVSVLSKSGGRPTNEDAYGFWTSRERQACFCVISDGAGGHRGGDVASRLAVEHVLAFFRGRPECSREAIEAALATANAGLIERQAETSDLAAMRATAVVLALDARAGRALWGHIGDSRLYLFRRQRIVVQTRDDSVLQNMVAAGYVAPSALRGNPNRSALLAALGDEDAFVPHVERRPLPVEDGDLFLLCTDGLWEYVEEREMERLLEAAPSPGRWLADLEERVIAYGRAGQDNYSALAVACRRPRRSANGPREISV